MKDNEIIKALECCKMPVGSGACNGCPLKIVRDSLRKEDTKSCTMILIENAIDIINRQKAEIEQWKEEANRYQNLWCEAMKDIQTAKSEAIKEFVENLKDYHKNYEGFCVVDDDDIDNLVAEMTEGRENDN